MAALVGTSGCSCERPGITLDVAAGPSSRPVPPPHALPGIGRLLHGLLSACGRRLRRTGHGPHAQLAQLGLVQPVRPPRHQRQQQQQQQHRQRGSRRDTATKASHAVAPAPAPVTLQLVDSCMDMQLHHSFLDPKDDLELQLPLQRAEGRHRKPLARLGRLLGGLGATLGRFVSPKGPGDNDTSVFERVVNMLTCIPFFTVGRSFVRRPKFAAYGQAMQLVGAVAAVYHSSSGQARLVMRKADYWSIALSTVLLRRAAVGQLPRGFAACMLGLLPVKPTLVTAANLAAVELKCAGYALSPKSSPHLLHRWLSHLAIGATATASFGLEATLSRTPIGPLAHASWHCLAAAAMTSMAGVLHAADER